MAKGFVADIDELTLTNSNFRKVIFTTGKSQLVVMHLNPREDIGLETHPENDQFLKIESGSGKVIIEGEETPIKKGSAIVIPAGTEHNILNTSEYDPLKIYTVYTPPHHRLDVIHETKDKASADNEEFDGKTNS